MKTSTIREAVLLKLIQENPDGRWKTSRAIRALRAAGIHPVSPGNASTYLLNLAAAGHLILHENKGCRWYETSDRARSTPKP